MNFMYFRKIFLSNELRFASTLFYDFASTLFYDEVSDNDRRYIISAKTLNRQPSKTSSANA